MLTEIYLAVITEDPASADTGATVDYFARWMAVGGYVLTGISLFVTMRPKVWRKKSDQAQALRDPVKQIADSLAKAEQSGRAALDLWTTPVSASLTDLRESREELDDSKLRKLLDKLHKEVQDARGLQQPTLESLDNQPEQLSSDQLHQLRMASATASKIKKRINKLTQKGKGAT